MVHSNTKSRYRNQLIFSLFVVLTSWVLYFVLPSNLALANSSYLFDILGVIAFLVVWQLGIPMPYIGIVSMERAVQFFLLLTIDFHQAAVINAIAAMIWPFANKKYSQNSLKVSFVKSIHNSGMVAIMMLVSGFIIHSVNSAYPVLALSESVIVGVIFASISIQFLNFSILGAFYRLDDKKLSQLFSYLNFVIEIIFVPLGVLAAVIYNNNETSLFILLLLFTVSVLFAFHSNAFVQRESVDLSHIKKIGYDHNNLLSVTKDLANNIKSLLHFDSFYVALLNTEKNELEVVYQTHKKSRKPLNLFIYEVEKAMESEILYSNNNLQLDSKAEKSVLIAPMINHEGVYGAINLLSNSSNAYSVSDGTIIKEIADKYSMILSYARAYEILEHHTQKLENLVDQRTRELSLANSEKQHLLDEVTEKSLKLKQLSEQDYLTGLFNRRYFNSIISDLNSTVNISISLIDLDHFKLVNDTYGHGIGDEVLVHIAKILNSVFSEKVTIARFGGEEFVVLFDNIDYSTVKSLNESFRQSVQSFDWSAIAKGLKLTVSLGVENSTTNQSINNILDQADQNLYKAKNLGRNQIVFTKGSSDK